MIIRCENIQKIYKGNGVETAALKDIDLKVDKGEFVAIMGPSGSGKSTLMHILGALDTPTSGSYFLDGEDISKYDENDLADIRLRKIGFVFQQFNLLPRLTAIKNVMLPLVYANVERSRREEMAASALESVGLPERSWRHRSNELSGGEMQRVAIARALINNPPLILADEPTGNLDSKTSEVVMKTFTDLNDKGRTVVLITHERDIAEHAKRVIHIKDGQIISEEKIR